MINHPQEPRRTRADAEHGLQLPCGSSELVFPWGLSPKSLVAFEGKIQSLASLIKDKKLQSVYLHGDIKLAIKIMETYKKYLYIYIHRKLWKMTADRL